MFVNVHIEGELFTLASLYAPNKKPIVFLNMCLASLQSFASGPLIIGGDLNCLMSNNLDYSGSRRRTDSTWNRVDSNLKPCQILEKYHLYDIRHFHHPKERDYTFYSHCHDSHSRLDYLLVSTALLQNFVDSNIGLRICSDHAWTEGDFYLRNLKTQRLQ